jgi:di/tricarboxylate transporter
VVKEETPLNTTNNIYMKLIYEFENYWHRKFIVLLLIFGYYSLSTYLSGEYFYEFRIGLVIVFIFSIIYLIFFTKIKSENLLLDKKKETKKSKTIKQLLQLIILIVVLFGFYLLIKNAK